MQQGIRIESLLIPKILLEVVYSLNYKHLNKKNLRVVIGFDCSRDPSLLVLRKREWKDAEGEIMDD